MIALKVIPKASRNEIVGWENDALKIKVTACPEKGLANAAVISLLAKSLKVAKGQIVLISGNTSQHKRVRLLGIDEATLKTLLALNL